MGNSSNIQCLGYSVFNDTLDNIRSEKKVLVNTINQYSYCLAEEDKDFKESLMGSDILLPDGVGLVVAAKLLKKRKIKKIAGADLHEFLLNKLNTEEGSCFYMGSSVETLEKIKKRIKVEYPKIVVNSYSPPFKKVFSNQENDQIIKEVNRFKPDILFIGMTAPKQEKWAFSHKSLLQTNLICSIGAVFDFYAGTVERPSKILINLNLEWFGRFIKEPKRMWKRYIYYGVIFGFYLMKEKYRLFLQRNNQLL